MNIKKLNIHIQDAKDVPAVFDEANIAFNAIGILNWENYNYKPDVQFRIAHTDNAILIHYHVTEKSVRAKYGEDGGAVYKDSCVEFFSVPGGDCIYYNIECNCIGTILMEAGCDRHGREVAPLEVTKQIKRWSSLGNEPFEERVGECSWELALIIPYSVFFKHHIQTLDNQLVKANFYKCGDELETPHYVTWNPIKTEQPDYHRPEFFGETYFE